MNRCARAFGWVVLLGIALDWLYVLPGIWLPNAVAASLGGDPARLPVWPAFVCLLLFLITLFLFSGALDIHRYRANAWLALLVRLAIVVFLLCLYPGTYTVVAIVNLVLLVAMAWLLSTAIRTSAPVSP